MGWIFWLFWLCIICGIFYLYTRPSRSGRSYRLPAPRIVRPVQPATHRETTRHASTPNNASIPLLELETKLFKTEYWTNNDDYSASQPAPDHDNWEGTFWDVESPKKINASLRIEYEDGAGSLTQREIRLMKYGPWEGGAILWAFCQLRQANRTFRTDRIISCTDIETGEVIDDLEMWLDDKYHQSPDRAIESIVESARDALRVLHYVSKADGRLTQKERVVVRDAVRGMSDHPSIDDKRIDDMFDLIETPSMASFKLAFGRLINKDREMAENVVKWSEAIVATEKTASSAEQEVMIYLKNRLGKKPRQAGLL